MAIYKAVWHDRKGEHEGLPYRNISLAVAEADLHVVGSRVVIIVRDSEGADYPDNAGKWFLERILK
jgi:hypothetical protein